MTDPHRSPEQDRGRRSASLGTVIAAIAVAFLLLAAGCSGGDDFATVTEAASVTEAGAGSADFDASAPLEADVEPGVAASEEAPASSANDQAATAEAITSGSAGGQPIAQLPDLGRDIIFTASLELATTDVSAATREAIRSIEGRGGFLFSQQTQGGPGGSSVLTFKVLPDQFQAALNDLGSIGTVRSQSISAEDVSAIVVDLESRITTAEASVVRLRNLLDEATALETIATLENQLLQRETALEQLRGQLRSVRGQVDLATITVIVTELLNRPSLSIEVLSFAGHDGGFGCFDSPSSKVGEVDDPFTICYRVTNTGDAALVDLAIAEAGLGATVQDMVLVDGNLTQLDPGEVVVLAYEFELTEPVRVRPVVTATGLNDAGEPIEEQVKATGGTIRFDVTNFDDDLPGFGEVLRNSSGALVTAAHVVALFVVAIAPFLAVATLLALVAVPLVRRVRVARAGRRADRPGPTPARSTQQAPAPTAAAAPPPPPPTVTPGD